MLIFLSLPAPNSHYIVSSMTPSAHGKRKKQEDTTCFFFQKDSYKQTSKKKD
jgi:hypothetical protein